MQEEEAFKSYLVIFGKKGCFNGNQDYVIIPNKVAIEGLFPDHWVVELHQKHPGWFEVFMPDAAGGVSEFKVGGVHKKTNLC
nr:hypothetical protein GCM10020185_34610 [Pseudomonas brassicacearum subsp. brassicacearum]